MRSTNPERASCLVLQALGHNNHTRDCRGPILIITKSKTCPPIIFRGQYVVQVVRINQPEQFHRWRYAYIFQGLKNIDKPLVCNGIP